MPMMRSMRTLVERNERFHGDTLHLISGDERITFRTFAQRARKLSSALYELGLRHQDRVSILAMNCREYLEVYGAGEVGRLHRKPGELSPGRTGGPIHIEHGRAEGARVRTAVLGSHRTAAARHCHRSNISSASAQMSPTGLTPTQRYSNPERPTERRWFRAVVTFFLSCLRAEPRVGPKA